MWGDAEHILAHILDVLAAGNWQRGGGKGRRPQPLPRPGKPQDEGRTYGKGGGMSVADAERFFRAWHDGSLERGESEWQLN